MTDQHRFDLLLLKMVKLTTDRPGIEQQMFVEQICRGM
jgi:hypothetical protein